MANISVDGQGVVIVTTSDRVELQQIMEALDEPDYSWLVRLEDGECKGYRKPHVRTEVYETDACARVEE